MAKRFTDTNKWNKRFIRGLKAPYKLLWIYICDECNHAGIWDIDFEIAPIKIGVKINEKDAIRYFGDKIKTIDNNSKWFIPSFIEFQYGELSHNNRAHTQVIFQLSKFDLLPENIKNKPLNMPLVSPLQGGKEQEQEKDKDKDKEQEQGVGKPNFESFQYLDATVIRPPQAPTLQAVIEFFTGQNRTDKEAKAFYDYHEGLGWRKGISPIMSWRSFANTWITNIRPEIKTGVDASGHTPAEKVLIEKYKNLK